MPHGYETKPWSAELPIAAGPPLLPRREALLELAKKNAKEAPAGHDVFYWQDQSIKQRYSTHIRGFWRCPWFITGLGDYTGGNLSYYDTSGGVYHELQGYQGNGGI